MTDHIADTVRAIRRVELRALRERTQASMDRQALLQQLVDLTGSQQAAGEALGTSRQAVSKALSRNPLDDGEAAAYWGGEPPLNYLHADWEYGSDVVTESEWQELPATEAAAAADRAHQAWSLLAYVTSQLSRWTADLKRDLLEATQDPELLPELEGPLRPGTVEDAQQMLPILDGLWHGLSRTVEGASEQRRSWAERLGAPEAEAR